MARRERAGLSTAVDPRGRAGAPSARARRAGALLLAPVLLALAACGAGANPLADGSATPDGGTGGRDPEEVVVGSANFTESAVLGELYAQAMTAAGVPASTRPDIGAREVYLTALDDGSVDLVPEYTGNLLTYLDPDTGATTAEQIETELPQQLDDRLALGPVAGATNQNVYVVTADFARQSGVAALGDLAPLAPDLVLGGRAELAERSFGLPGLAERYGVEFGEFRPYDALAVKIRDLDDDKIQVATFYTTDAAVTDQGYVELDDPENLVLPQNVVPLMTSAVAEDPAAAGALEAVQSELTTEDLRMLNKAVDTDRRSPEEVAGGWLEQRGLS